MENETYVVSPTGGRKGQKLARFDLIPTLPLRKLAEQYGRGAEKYGDNNWRKGYSWSLSYAAAQRHLTAFWGGEDYDPEFPDAHHLDAAMFHLMAMRDFVEKYPEYDDRPETLNGFDGPDVEGMLSEAIKKARETEVGGTPTGFLTKHEQAKTGRRISEIQTSRWQIP